MPPPSPLRFVSRFFAQPRLVLSWLLALGRNGWWVMNFIYTPIFVTSAGYRPEIGGALVSLGLAPMLLVRVYGRIGREIGIRNLLCVGYGLTESTSGVAMIFGEELEQRPGSVGRALPTVRIEIRDGSGRALPDGAEGEIHLHGPQVMREYWRRPEESAEVLRPGRWLRTGDWGRLEDGYLYVNSRKRDLILRAFEAADQNHSQAAKLLGVHPNYLHRLVRNYDLRRGGGR